MGEENLENIKAQYPEYIPNKPSKRFVDRTGLVYGRLKVIYRTYNDKHDEAQWVCKCDCGNYGVFRANHLQTGKTLSCGCLQKEQVFKSRHKINEYLLFDDYGIGYTSNTNKEFYFDIEDYDLIKDYCWFENDQGYILSKTFCEGNKPAIRMHRFIMNPTKEQLIDHKDLNKANNRKYNLRIANKQTNGINRPCNKNNKLGVKGVSLNSDNKTYSARIVYNNKEYYLGSFETLEKAKQVRLEAEKELYKEFAYEE